MRRVDVEGRQARSVCLVQVEARDTGSGGGIGSVAVRNIENVISLVAETEFVHQGWIDSKSFADGDALILGLRAAGIRPERRSALRIAESARSNLRSTEVAEAAEQSVLLINVVIFARIPLVVSYGEIAVDGIVVIERLSGPNCGVMLGAGSYS